MKELIVFMFSVVLLGSCSYTTYEGTLIFPENVRFDKPNFKYVATIEGSATAEWIGFWISRHEKVNGLINEAKKNMYKNHVFRPNQIVTNLTKDVVRTSGGDGKTRLNVKVIMSGDVYEFSDNGIFSENDSKKLLNKTIQNNNQEEKLNLDNIAVVKAGFTDYSEDFKLKKGIIVLFNVAGKYYKAVVNYKDYGKTNMKDIQVYDFETNNWIPSEREYVTVPNTTIIGYKL